MTSNKNDDSPAKAFDRMLMLITSTTYPGTIERWQLSLPITIGVMRRGQGGAKKLCMLRGLNETEYLCHTFSLKLVMDPCIKSA